MGPTVKGQPVSITIKLLLMPLQALFICAKISQ
jgi:hypothetical protein